MTDELNIATPEGAEESAPSFPENIGNDLTENIVRRTIGKTTYVANLHFKEQGQTFSQKLKRVLKADANI